MSKVLITGPTGCIGSATVSYLFNKGVDEIIGFSRNADPSRIEPELRDRIQMVQGDIANKEQVCELVKAHQPTHIIHLAAFQTPDCQEYPFRGMDINVAGTAYLFEAAAEAGSVERFVFASSSAVYGPRAMYAGDTVPSDGAYKPPNLYGYWKVCGEGMAQAFHMETGVSTVSLRLSTTYGPGRDKGFTSAPTTAMKSVIRNEEYVVPYTGREHYHYVHDVAAGFGESCIAPFEGYGAFNLRGRTVPLSDFLDLVKGAAEELGIGDQYKVSIADDAMQMPFVCDLDDSDTLAAFPDMSLTDLKEGVTASLARFKEMADSGQELG